MSVESPTLTKEVHRSRRHDSAREHVSGRARYIDDLPEAEDLLHVALVTSPLARGRINGIDLDAARKMPGVIDIVIAADICGENEIGAVGKGEVLFAAGEVEYYGQPVAAVAATSLDDARRAAAAVVLDLAPLPPILSIDAAMAAKSFLRAPMVLERGEVDAALAAAPHRVSGTFSVGGQEHFYLEGQIALAWMDEGGGLCVHSSTQHPSEVQHTCARLLGLDHAQVTVTVRRMGGGFGGKETNASWVAGVAAIIAHRNRRPAKIRLPRKTDMIATGKRHPFNYTYTVGFDDTGRILAVDAVLAADGGHSLDMTGGVVMRALTHVDNAYFVPHFRAVGYSCKTNTVSNTAFRGFGGPQGVVVLEDAILRIAHALGKTPEEIRARCYYDEGERSITPYEQPVGQNLIRRVTDEAMKRSDWDTRRARIDAFNRAHPTLRRGLGLFPLKFGIGFSAIHLNQAGALVHVHPDGSVRLSHGGTEMGQGLFVKIAQVVAEVFGIELPQIRLSTTSTAEVANTSATAASTGSDLNGWAAYNAASSIRDRMALVAAKQFDTDVANIKFADGLVKDTASNQSMSFGALAKLAYLDRTKLSESGFYKMPGVHWNGETMRGNPYFYFAYGAAVSEVVVDLLTGEMRVLSAHLVQDCGSSLNPAIDFGQIEGAFAQGLGWFVCEALTWNEKGELLNHGPSTYKIPGSRDAPAELDVHIIPDSPAEAATIFKSKGVGEPPLMLATAIWTAVKDALGSVGTAETLPVQLDAPMLSHRILAEVERLRGPHKLDMMR